MFSFSETHCRENLFPLTLTRHSADIRTGIFTIREKWAMAAGIYPGLNKIPDIPANLVPGTVFFQLASESGLAKAMESKELYRMLRFPWDILTINAWAIEQDFALLKILASSAPVPDTNRISGSAGQVFVEPGARVEHCYLNTVNGPIHIGKNAELMEGVMVRGPVSIGEGAVVKMGAAVYGATTIGPWCIIGGEVKNSVFMSNSNKAHDGYIGDAVIGAWCNLGAGTSCSNIRNTATVVKVWHMQRRSFVEAGIKCGLIMGDYSRCGINSSFNTGTVVGVCANIFQSGQLLPKYIPSFSWGTDTGIRYDIEKAISDIGNWMAFKRSSLTENEKEQLRNLYSNIDNI